MSQPVIETDVPQFIRNRAERFGEETLVVLGGERLTYAEADERSSRLARGLLASGVGKGSRVGILFPNGPEWIVSWLAAARIGALTVPINTFSVARELHFVLHHADVDTLLTARRFLSHDYPARLCEAAPELRGHDEGPIRVPSLPYLRRVFASGAPAEGDPAFVRSLEDLESAAAEISEEHLHAVEACVCAADPLAIVYSSGSTAAPKGAVHSHGALLRHAANVNALRDFERGDRLYSPMPFFWVGGLVFTLLCSMEVGACVLCEERFEPGETLDLIERERATLVAGWPHFASAMAAHPSFASRDLSAIRGGNLYALLPEERRPDDPLLRANSLGMTETCGPHTLGRMEEELPAKLRGSFGRALPGITHKVVDPASGATLGPDEEGEICVRGYSLMQGLYKQEREETFDADGYYHTGDSGRFDAAGHCFFSARLGEMIKTGGANVTPAEVEAVLHAQPEVSEAYVVGLDSAERGQEVGAALVLEAGAELDAGELRRRLRADLSPYKIPRHVFCVAKAELPFLDSGKLDRRELVRILNRRVAGDPV